MVGDMSQPRGGPMLTGHASHQVGLDADIWLTPMPDRTLSRRRARIDVGDEVVRDGPARRRSQSVDTRAHRADPHRVGGPGRRAHLRQRSDQESAYAAKPERIAPGLPRFGHGGGTTIIFTSASIVRPTARNASRSRRRRRVKAAATNSITGSRRGAASEAGDRAGETKTGDDDGAVTGRLPSGADGAVTADQNGPSRTADAERRRARSMSAPAQTTISAA